MQLEAANGEAIAGRSVIVTGAASGIGRALASGFARDGAFVVGVDRNGEGLAGLESEGVRGVVGDVTDPGTMQDAVAVTLEGSERIDALFNNAGFGAPGTVETLGQESFRSTIAVHLFAAFYGIKAVAPSMRRQRYGRIVNVLSRAAEACAPANSAYSAGKAALWALTRSVAGELIEDGVLVNGLVPGMTNTGIWGRPRPELQPPDEVYPTALALATLPAGGPNGRVFWDMCEYHLFERTIGQGVPMVGVPGREEVENR